VTQHTPSVRDRTEMSQLPRIHNRTGRSVASPMAAPGSGVGGVLRSEDVAEALHVGALRDYCCEGHVVVPLLL
jgi:hypothetical protein